MNDKILAIDASSAILLYKAAEDPYLLWQRMAVAYQVQMAVGAFDEVGRSGYDGAPFFEDVGGRLFTVVPEPILSGESAAELAGFSGLGRGEAETLGLLFTDRVSFVAVDDKKAVQICRRYQLPFVNALLVPRLLALSGIISRTFYEELFARLCVIGWYRPEIIAFACECPKDRLRSFLPSA